MGLRNKKVTVIAPISGGTFAIPGSITIPTGMFFSRASVATARTGASTVIDLTTDQAGIIQTKNGYIGLQHESSRTNIMRQDRALATTPWSVVGGVTVDAVNAPDGTLSAERLLAGSGTILVLQSQSISSSSTYAMSGWIKPHNNTTGPYQVAALRNPGLGLTIVSSGWLEATDNWKRFEGVYTTDATASQLGYFEWQNTSNWSTLATSVDNGITAMAEDIDAWGSQLEQGNFPTSLIHTTTTSATRAASYFGFSNASTCLDNGRLSLLIRCVPMGKHADFSSNYYLWYVDANNYALITAATRILTVVIGGSTVFTAGAALDWWQDRPLDIYLSVGNGTTSFAWQKWNSGWTILTGSSVASLSFGAVPIYIFSSSTTGHFDATVQSCNVHKSSYNPTTVSTVKTVNNIVCDGNSLTAGAGIPAAIGRWPEQVKKAIGEGFTIDYASAVVGQTTGQMSSDYATDIAPKYVSTARRNILVVWEITNDLLNYLITNGITAANADVSSAVTYVTGRYQTYCQTAQATGFLVIAADVIARGQLNAGANVPNSFEPARILVNQWLASNWQTFANGFVQIGNHSKAGVVATCSDTNWFSDYVHLTNLGYDVFEKLIVPVIEALAA